MKNRGVEDILIACVDGLTGFPQAIEAVFPQAEVQQCIIHQIRNTTKFVSYKELKPLMADLKRVYAAPTEEIALAELDSFDEKWSGKYPKIAKSWKDNCFLQALFPQKCRLTLFFASTFSSKMQIDFLKVAWGISPVLHFPLRHSFRCRREAVAGIQSLLVTDM